MTKSIHWHYLHSTLAIFWLCHSNSYDEDEDDVGFNLTQSLSLTFTMSLITHLMTNPHLIPQRHC